MKKLYILMLAMLCLTVATCKKDVEPYVFNADIKVTDIKTNTAVIEAINEEEGFERLEAVVLCSADEKVKEPKQYKMTYEDESFKANVDGLLQDTKYYYKIIFTGKYNSVETEVSSFETEKIVLPIVTTAEATEVTTTTAVCGGNVTSDGGGTITARGVCWSISKMPTIEDNKTTNGSGIGSFTSNLSNLSSQTTYYVRAYATNEAGTAYGEEKSFTTLEILKPTVKTNNVTSITESTATCGGNVTSDGNGTVSARGICWSTSPNPTIADNKTTDGSGTGSFTSSMTNLKANTTYYVRAYATNEKGTAYGEVKSFTTSKKAVSLPDVLKTTVSNVTSTTAVFGSGVFSDGGGIVTARGFCWSSTTETPTIANSSFTTNGSGLGSFSADVAGLKASTQYYVRAYATNEAGTAYGEEKSFTTLEILKPTVKTNNVTSITESTATCGGNVTSDGNGTVTARGICWSTSPNPTIDDNKTTDGSGIGNFTSNLSNLAPQTTYYVRAYATNEAGTSYGEEKSFTTRASTGTENGYGWVDLGLCVKWATCNVGADSPESYGDYYAWAETTTKSDYSSSNCPTYGLSISQLQSQGYIDSEGNLNPQYDAATANWGGDWRMPTYDELKELRTNCTWTWTTQNGVNGYNVEGPNGNSIFLPAAGYRRGSSHDDTGSDGKYLGSTPIESNSYCAYGLGFDSVNHNTSYLNRNHGLSVRPVFGGNFTGPDEEPEEPIILPTVTTTEVTNITVSSATCGGNVMSDGNGTVTARGICWSTSPNPTIDDNKTTEGSGIGSFTSSLSNLASQTTYYVRAYATNEKGTAYGEEKSFKTLEEEPETPSANQSFTVNGVSFTMIAVEGGTFKMGAQSSDSGGDNYDSDADSDESPVHSVTLSDYYIGETEVTQELWEAVMGRNPSRFNGYPQKPVEMVTWDDCLDFITKLNNLTGKNFGVPTEAEWEYAARGGNKSKGYKYSGSNTIGNVAWYWDNSSSTTPTTYDVKTKQANELGIYDMSGNVDEWCWDWYGNYSSGSQTNPAGASSGSYRVFRGGGWVGDAKGCRVSSRGYCYHDCLDSFIGLRLALSQY